MSVDLSKWSAGYQEAEVSDFTELPAGTYQCRVEKCHIKKSKAGDDMMAWEFSVLTPSEFNNRKIFVNTVFAEKTLSIIKGQVQKLGFMGDIAELGDEGIRSKFINKGVELKRSKGKPDEQGNERFNTYFQKEIEIIGNTVNIAPPMGSVPF